MELPSLPTDSFYKFFSISGLVGCIFCLSLGSKAVSDLASQGFDLELQVEKALIESRYLEENIDTLHSLHKKANEQMQNLESELPTLSSKRETDKALVRESMAQIKAGLNESKELHKKILATMKEQELKNAEIKVGRKRLADNERVTRLLINFMIFLSISLGLQSAWGFIMWYLKIQVPQDRILQNEVASLSTKKGNKSGASGAE
jgi:nitrate reductase NapE component